MSSLRVRRLRYGVLSAVELDDQHGAGVAGQPRRVDTGLHSVDRAPVDDFEGRRHQARFDDLDDGAKGCDHVRKDREQGLDALVTKPADPNIRNWKSGGYLDRMPKDPWGNLYQYLSPGNNGEIDIYTLGRDGRPGGEGVDADVGNWDLE